MNEYITILRFMQHAIRHGGSIDAYTAHDMCPHSQAQTNESRAEAEASDASEKLWQRMQNSRQARGNPCENTKKILRILVL